jgi:hypothetical protein
LLQQAGSLLRRELQTDMIEKIENYSTGSRVIKSINEQQ